MRRHRGIRRSKRKLFLFSILCLSLMPMTAYADTATTSVGSTSVSGSAAAERPVERVSSSPASTVKETAKPEAKITKEEAVAVARALFPQLNKAEARQVELGNNHSFPAPYQNVWNINWEIKNGNSSYGFNSLVDSISGELLQTHISGPYDDGDQAYYPPKVTEEEAFKLAKAFLFKASPSLTEADIRTAEQPKYAEGSLFGPVQYYFSFATLINGLPSPNENISITVNGNGEVTGYNRNKTVSEYPSSTPAVSLEDATSKYMSAFDLRLQYMPVYKPYGQEKTWFLGWVPSTVGDMIIDAHTGDFLNFSGEVVRPGELQYKKVAKGDKLFEPVKGQDTNGLLTSDQAFELAEALSPVVQSRTRASTYLNNHWSDRNKQVWNLNWSEKTPTGPYGAPQSSAIVDATTGQILEFRENNFFPPYMQQGMAKEVTGQEATITEREAEAKALDWVNRLYPNASDELKQMTSDPFASKQDGNNNFSFRFQRYIGDIPVSGDYTTITMDKGGKLLTYGSTRSAQSDTATASLQAKATKAEAEAAYREASELKLQYKNFGGYYTENNGYIEPKVKLTYGYTFKDEKKAGSMFDASTGQWRSVMNETGLAPDKAAPMPADVNGHRAQKDLETMVRYGILKPNDSGELRPDDAISVGDWLNMVALAVSPYYSSGKSISGGEAKPSFEDIDSGSPYYAAAELFVQSKWLDPKVSPKLGAEETLTREKLAVLLVNMVKYGKLAGQFNDRTELSFTDREQIKQRGAVWIAVQLGFFDGTQKQFEPGRTVTKAEAATALMQVVRLQGKLDQSIAR
ncbi:YcdB/YcdC domain-containing protein [Paenibacillus allorhizosphaerae]|uniref:S-layer homology domain-containing protein n=1 Tax=Paenibacillus allorhizosphaerae TaxID=2849866 RepID=A0ABN7TJ19_9BACL|nr:YcdB/YcdC domain-containing protein [Paenibacillus allorhizosphaerae]CAG7635458.1 hypothetical protein PAECIP111802_02143 [Paenibacillus allorhizosphaerae]